VAGKLSCMWCALHSSGEQPAERRRFWGLDDLIPAAYARGTMMNVRLNIAATHHHLHRA